jgi:hypothetical protein
MARALTPPPEPALKDFLDEVVVPILVERFLRDRRREETPAPGEMEGTVTRDGNVAGGDRSVRDTGQLYPFPVAVGP